MDPLLIIEAICSGVLIGGLYALIAVGLSIIWGVLDVINLSHGDFIIVGSYIVYWLFLIYGLDPWIYITIAFIVGVVLGLVVEKITIKPLIGRSPLTTLLATYGISIILENSMLALWGGRYRTIMASRLFYSIEIKGVTITISYIEVFIISLIILYSLHLLLTRTNIGRAIRAVSQNKEAALLLGIDVDKIYLITFAIGTGLAAIGGGFYGCIYAINPWAGVSLTPLSFIIVVLGSTGSILGSFIGGIIIEVAESLSSLFISPAYTRVISFLIFIIILLIKPEGLFGGK